MHKSRIRSKYQHDELFKRIHKSKLRSKYLNDENFKEKQQDIMKKQMKKLYHNDQQFKHTKKANMKTLSKIRYKGNEFKEKKLMSLKMKYKRIEKYRQNVIKQNRKRSVLRTVKLSEFDIVLEEFRKIISHGPEYVCCVCLKLLFENQVLKCKKSNYKIHTCISEEYLHVCNSECRSKCLIGQSARSTLWICFTCHRKLQAGKVPAEANMNNLQLHEVPEELANLNNLEQHLIALNIPFMKLMALPKGGQNGVHGPVVCVPSNTYETVDMLPRPQTEDQLIRVKLKRKLSYKSYYEYKFVDKSNLLNALQYLKANNKWYFDVAVNDKWENSLERNEKDNEKEEAVEIGGKARLAKYWKEMEEQIDYILSKDKNANENMQDNSKLQQKIDDNNTEDDMEERLRGIQLDSCLQPVDIGQEILDQYFEDIICCAPCEGRSPVSILQDESNEAKCFPVLFPKGQPTFHDRRDEKITLGRYLHNRLMHVDNRFAQNTDYIFYAQYIYEIQQVISQVSIALRQSPNKKDDSSSITASDLKDAEKVKKILKSDKGYKFLKQIRGTPPFWQKTQKDVLAMVRQLGKPTWFASFSSADMRWPELMNTLLRQKGDTRESSELDYTEKCNLLRSNPVTVARMFDKRFHTFMKRVILSPAAPIGKVVDSFWRVEYQARGSPHIHALFWVENAPQLGIDKDDDVVQFVDKYISCQKPDEKEDRELHEIVSKVQQHSKKHSKSCTKTGKACRFNFPRPPSEKTFIVTPVEEIPAKDCGKVQNKGKDNDQIKASTKIKDDAEKLLKSVKDALSNGIEYNSVNHLFEKLGITQNQFENAHNELASQQSIIIKREIQDVWVNQFNPSLLRSWNANMDLQFVTNVFACVAYIVSYMSKAEREIGMLLSHTLSEMKEGNENAKESMKKLGQVYMQNREVSAQESVYRVCSLRLKESSRKVEFIPVGPDPVRMSLPLSVIKSRPDNDNDDDENVWMPSKLDRYKARPKNAEFSDMCLATFCSQYRILTASQTPSTRSKNVFKLDNDLGYIQKRTRTGDAVVRYPRFSPIISPEKYYLSILQLFLPYFEDGQLKPPTFETHEEFYETGSVKICGRELEKVWSIVCTNRKKFEMNADAIDHAQEHLDKFGPHEDAWGLLCPEKEVERLEHPKENVDVEDCDGDLDIPDLKNEPKKDDYSIELRSVKISKQDGHSLMRSLNEKQQSVFYKIRQWCLDRVNGKSVEPFHMFLTGGAGTGKSHLIKCLYYEATRILARMLPHPDDVSVLKMAPTGVAAYNINGHTIHSILSIPINAQRLYQPLSDEKISVLRNKLAELQILIIDEVSMVNQKLMSYIHGRLRQIKQSRDQTAFAGVSVIAVGDMYQLPPVLGTPLYKDTLNGALWNANFKKVELEDIMRQKDDTQFAFLLNRLRVKQGEEILCDEDLAMLKSCETGEECENALHIYACNNEVDAWNKKLLHKKCGDVICVKAQDMDKDVKKGNQIREKPYTKMKTQLPPYLWIAVNARVMLLKNIDVSKGLTNGCFGNVTEIITDHTNLNPVCIKVNFEKADIGIHSIEMSQESIGKKYVRKQFPLKLAYACTIHKVQGSTLDKAVVSLKNVFQSGQAYVGLSRVTSLSGLVIEHFDPKRIYCNPEIKERIEIMKPFIENETSEDIHDYNFSLVMQNVQGLKQHFTDFKSQCQFVNVDCICLTETWINDDDLCDVVLDNFRFYHQPRHLSYCNSGVGNVLKEQSHGGVAMYIKNTYSSRLDISVDNLEFIAILVTKPVSVVISVVYRPPSYSIKSFCESLDNLLDVLHKTSIRCIVMGDFNEDLFKGSLQVNKLMCNKGYKQHVVNATTEKGTLIDHVYSKGLDLLETEVIPTYYSYHEAVKIAF
ncbi:uncharacterized protein LOC115920595 [Strongylocentrotus purpuratus]|uniref:ATP-dependent DNA helicase n=1 Tax=Strongylocentrotus purpuratus TaxID=7668 RepID=A0A7M7N7Q5_STRPU|nr:uncharacterized protein LOC115920595 [Strongylocentrotus purpuratus]